jgi:hypothetical protein
MTESPALRHAGKPTVARTTDVAPPAARAVVPTLVFSVALAVLVVGPPLLPQPFAPYPLLTIGMVLDLLTPVVLIPAGWWALRRASGGSLTTAATFLFVALAAVLIEGQAMHLAANAIGEHVADGGGDAARLTHDLDELVSHVIWHGALVGLSVLIIVTAAGSPPESPTRPILAALCAAAFAFGATFFLMVVEGGTGIIGVPAAVAVSSIGIWRSRRMTFRRGAVSVFVLGYALATLLFVGWAAMNGWSLPEFSEVGLL